MTALQRDLHLPSLSLALDFPCLLSQRELCTMNGCLLPGLTRFETATALCVSERLDLEAQMFITVNEY